MKIEVKDLVYEYPTGDLALNGVSLVIEGTTPVAIVGQNGSGKTTLVKHFNRILTPTKGEVLIDGTPTTEQTTAKWARCVGYVFQNPDDQLFLSTVRKELEFGPRCAGLSQAVIDDALPEVARLCGLEDKLEEHPFDLTASQKKFCTIGSIIMMDPGVVVFDEPTCGQDVSGNSRLAFIIAYLREKGKLCITISHDMKFVAANFERMIAMYQGKVLLDGETKEVFAKPEVLNKSFVTPPPICRIAQGIGLKKPVFEVGGLLEMMGV